MSTRGGIARASTTRATNRTAAGDKPVEPGHQLFADHASRSRRSIRATNAGFNSMPTHRLPRVWAAGSVVARTGVSAYRVVGLSTYEDRSFERGVKRAGVPVRIEHGNA